ncbi:MAG: hypothetical protein AABX44_00775, partial [Nanoarchaeota archaeon]
RTCNDLTECGTILDKPLESQSCDEFIAGGCIPDWTCADYGECIDGFKERICTDSNNCGIETGKPDEARECNPIKTKSILFIVLGIVGLILIILLILYFVKKRKSDEESSENPTYNQPHHPRSPPASTDVYVPRTHLAHQR